MGGYILHLIQVFQLISQKPFVAKLVNDPNAATSFKTLDDAWKAWSKSQDAINNGLINRRVSELKIYHQGIYERR